MDALAPEKPRTVIGAAANNRKANGSNDLLVSEQVAPTSTASSPGNWSESLGGTDVRWRLDPPSAATVVDAGGAAALLVEPRATPDSTWATSASKRLIDIAVSSTALLLSAPLWAAVWLINVVFERGPLLYVHTRVGEGGKKFDCYKFRTMIVDADRVKQTIADDSHHDDPRTFKIKRDPRVTLAGRWLRKLSLDEVPQLVNVLLGDMSLVGPRPPLPAEVELYSPRDWMRLAVKPGLTCIWQVSGRSDIPFEQQLEMDIEYIQRQGLLFDLGLMAKTIPAVLSCRGAY